MQFFLVSEFLGLLLYMYFPVTGICKNQGSQVWAPAWPHNFSGDCSWNKFHGHSFLTADSRRAVVNLGGLSLPRNSASRLIDCLNMTEILLLQHKTKLSLQEYPQQSTACCFYFYLFFIIWTCIYIQQLLHDKTNKMTCAPSEDSDQTGHPPSLIRVFAEYSMGS